VNVVAREPVTTGLHLCFHARSREQVDAFHAAGLGAGFQSNGEPGYRDYGPGYYAAYLLDPDGNNIEALYRDEGNIGHGRLVRAFRRLTPDDVRWRSRAWPGAATPMPEHTWLKKGAHGGNLVSPVLHPAVTYA